MTSATPGARQFFGLGFGWLTGLGLAGLLHGGAQLVSPSPGWLSESIILATGGNVLVGVVLLPVLALLALTVRRDGAWSMGRGLVWGLAVGLLPVVGTLAIRLELYRGHATVGFWALPLLALLAARWPRGRLLGVRAVTACGVSVLAAWLYFVATGATPAFEVDPASGRATQLQAMAAQTGEPVSAQRPDVILVSLDTMRADAVVGEHRALVPTMDRLAARGLVAPYARSGSNCTLPGHIEMFSGVGPLRHGILNNSGETPGQLPILGQLFSEAGWNTAAVISNRVIERRFGPSRGFDEWHDDLGTAHNHLARLGENTLLGWISDRDLFARLLPLLFLLQDDAQSDWGAHEAQRTTQLARSRVAELTASPRPYLLVVHYMDAHDPYRAPAPFLGSRTAAPGASIVDYDEQRARYWEEVDYLDSEFAKLIDSLDQASRPYVILVTGDHGEHLGEQDMLGHSDELYEAVVRVPFLLAGQGVPQGDLPPVSLIDVAPTLLACAGLPIPDSMQGEDVRQQLGRGLDSERFLFGRDERSVSATVDHWKWTADWPRGAELPEEGIFRHLAEDPGEIGPPAAEAPPGMLDRIKELLGEAILRGGAEISAERRAALIQLGYVDSASE